MMTNSLTKIIAAFPGTGNSFEVDISKPIENI